MASRPRLKPYHRLLRRGPDSVQLGVSGEGGGIVVCGLSQADILLLEHLDGSYSDHQVRNDVAARCGVSPERAAELLDLLHAHQVLAVDALDRADLGRLGPSMRDGLVHDAEILSLVRDSPDDPMTRIIDRSSRTVVVSGSGRLPWSIASLLRTSGVGQVHLGRWAVDAAERELRHDGAEAAPDLVILVAEGAIDPNHGEPWRKRSVPQLPVISDGQRIVVGPIVGRAADLPCLRCLEMARADRDPSWPVVMAQLVPQSQTREIRSESTIVAIAAGVVGMVTHSYLGGAPMPAGVSVEVTLPWPRLDHRRWHVHPGCPSHPSPTAAASPHNPAAESRVTMTG